MPLKKQVVREQVNAGVVARAKDPSGWPRGPLPPRNERVYDVAIWDNVDHVFIECRSRATANAIADAINAGGLRLAV